MPRKKDSLDAWEELWTETFTHSVTKEDGSVVRVDEKFFDENASMPLVCVNRPSGGLSCGYTPRDVALACHPQLKELLECGGKGFEDPFEQESVMDKKMYL